MNNLKTIEVKITGKVQGVWFRKYTLLTAKSLHITGFVRNEPNHSVYAMATGTEEDLKAFIQFCHKGSPLSHVDKVAINECSSVQIFESFTIA